MAKKSKPKIDKKMIIDAFAEMAREKNIDKDLLQGIVEETLSMIVKKKYGNNSDFEIVVNMQKGDLEIYLIKQVVEEVEDPEVEITLEEANLYSVEPLQLGDEFIEEITLDNIADSFGRRLVSFASQIMSQKIHEVERDNVFHDYSSKVGELIVGEVFSKRSYMISVMHNGVEMKLLREDQIPNDMIFQKKNKPIKAVVKSVDRTQGSGVPEILLSRKSDQFVMRLFESEIPEVGDGIVQIKAIAREAGERMKVAVFSVVDKIDPVGACVGLKGIRINSIIRELGNENIDLIPWMEDTSRMIEKAILPAKVKEVIVSPETKSATVIVSEEQVAIAVGRNGQNVRLASMLTGYDLKVLKEGSEDIEIDEFESELGNDMLIRLKEAKIFTARDFLEAEPLLLLKRVGITYNLILENRRIMLLEFDENENEEYINSLVAASNTIDAINESIAREDAVESNDSERTTSAEINNNNIVVENNEDTDASVLDDEVSSENENA
ncbi:MAG: transcription termination factor NusA [Ignavibacteria bacterium]|jgi:N utilization substance protein A|nr:transcription termination factor NusA [Ignavibacteria bacterium]